MHRDDRRALNRVNITEGRENRNKELTSGQANYLGSLRNGFYVASWKCPPRAFDLPNASATETSYALRRLYHAFRHH